MMAIKQPHVTIIAGVRHASSLEIMGALPCIKFFSRLRGASRGYVSWQYADQIAAGTSQRRANILSRAAPPYGSNVTARIPLAHSNIARAHCTGDAVPVSGTLSRPP